MEDKTPWQIKVIAINVASRSRPDKCTNMLYGMWQMMDSKDNLFSIWLKLDVDDPCYEEYITSIRGLPDDLRKRIKVIPGKSDSKIHAINRDPQLSQLFHIIFDVSDDFIFTKQGFDNIIRANCGPDDCLHFPEPFATSQSEKAKNENIIIMACMGYKYYDRFGYIYNPEYKSLFCDNELTAVAKKLGRYKFVNESIFYHAHPAAGYGKADAQTQHTESFWKEDKATYYRRKEAGFP